MELPPLQARKRCESGSKGHHFVVDFVVFILMAGLDFKSFPT